MNYQIRNATEKDLPTIRDLIREGRINPTGVDWARFIVAENDAGEVIGCGQIKPHRDGSQELASLVVREAWQNQGIARGLVNHLIASHEGDLYLMCGSGVGGFYEKLGWYEIQTEEMPRYFKRMGKVAGILATLARNGQRLMIMKLGQREA